MRTPLPTLLMQEQRPCPSTLLIINIINSIITTDKISFTGTRIFKPKIIDNQICYLFRSSIVFVGFISGSRMRIRIHCIAIMLDTLQCSFFNL
jgi:hypothetical protein